MKKALIFTGLGLLLAPAVVVAGYLGLQAYLDWLIAGAKRPLTGPQRPRAFGGPGLSGPPDARTR
ncbi:MAG TPA: hypothetical protein VFE37_05940 [Chloroflexota bacterium]|nr:hypothetical protein [Chloroflexota bacterium]